MPRQVPKRLHTWEGHGSWPLVALWSDGINCQAGLGRREPRLLALGMSRLHGLGSAVLLQPVTCLSSSLRRCSQLPDRVQVPHHHPCRVDDHCEDGFSLEATDDTTRVDILGLQQGGT